MAYRRFRLSSEATAVERVYYYIACRTDTRCWEWIGVVSRHGYGEMGVGGRSYKAHRFSYEAFVGPIPSGLQLDHLCRNRRCVNPEHLEPVTSRENTQRGGKALLTHCHQGHEFTAANTYVYKGHRQCRACTSKYRSNWRKAQRSATL